ncbi:B30.2/SPRY domain-containing protein [Entamoeba marina]
MKVSFHLCLFEDVLNFMMVCKKAKDTIKSLKVNPFFGNTPSLQQFIKHFKVETIECNVVGYFSPSLYEDVKCIRSPLWDNLKEEDEEIAKKFYQKLHEDHNKVNDFFIKEAIQFTNLQKIEGAIELLLKFFETYTQKGEMMYVNFPKRVKILTSKGYAITFNEEFLNQMKQLLTYIPNNGLTDIDVIVYNSPLDEDNDLLKELLQSQRVNYHYRVVSPNQTTSYEDYGYVNGDRFNNIFEKSYTTSCIIRHLSYDKEAPTWNIPKCITNVEMGGSVFFGIIMGTGFKSFNATVGTLQELSIKEIKNLNIPLPFNNLVKIKVEKSSNCRFILNSQKLEHISLRDVTDCLFVNSIDSVKEIIISKANNCVLPYVSFENRSIHIEDSNYLYFGEKNINVFNYTENEEEEEEGEGEGDIGNDEVTNVIREDQKIVENVQSPLKFMGIELNDFNKLITDCLIYPSDVDLKTLLTKSTIFKMRAFHPQTRRVKVDGNVIQRVIPQGEDGADLVVSSKFYVENDDLMVVDPKNPKNPIPAIIRYFEVEVQNYCIISIGLVDSRRYEFEEDRHVGWDKGSIGFHADDGCLFIGHGTNPIENYGKAYGGKNGEKNIVGCGYNAITQEIFYTVNGTKLEPLKINFQNISAAIGLTEFDPITINYGDSPFVFDYYAEMEKYKQQYEPELDDLEQDLDNVKKDLDNIKKELDNTEKELDNTEKKLDNTEKELDDSKQEKNKKWCVIV